MVKIIPYKISKVLEELNYTSSKEKIYNRLKKILLKNNNKTKFNIIFDITDEELQSICSINGLKSKLTYEENNKQRVSNKYWLIIQDYLLENKDKIISEKDANNNSLKREKEETDRENKRLHNKNNRLEQEIKRLKTENINLKKKQKDEGIYYTGKKRKIKRK